MLHWTDDAIIRTAIGPLNVVHCEIRLTEAQNIQEKQTIQLALSSSSSSSSCLCFMSTLVMDDVGPVWIGSVSFFLLHFQCTNDTDRPSYSICLSPARCMWLIYIANLHSIVSWHYSYAPTTFLRSTISVCLCVYNRHEYIIRTSFILCTLTHIFQQIVLDRHLTFCTILALQNSFHIQKDNTQQCLLLCYLSFIFFSLLLLFVCRFVS